MILILDKARTSRSTSLRGEEHIMINELSTSMAVPDEYGFSSEHPEDPEKEDSERSIQ